MTLLTCVIHTALLRGLFIKSDPMSIDGRQITDILARSAMRTPKEMVSKDIVTTTIFFYVHDSIICL
jgi:hypothetical protein